MKEVFATIALIVLLLAGGLATLIWRSIPPTPDAATLPSTALEEPEPRYRELVERGRILARERTAQEKLPGLSVAVAVDGELVWAEGFRWADMAEEIPVTPRTRFRVGGLSQTITAAAAALLVQRARLDLDAPIQRYVPGFPELKWPLSTRELMAHSAGIRPFKGEGGIFGGNCTDDAERFALFERDPQRFRPRTAIEFSTFGWSLVGAAISEAAGEPYLDFVRREVLVAVGMEQTGPEIPGQDLSDAAHFYYPRMMLNPRHGLQDSPSVDLSCHLAAVGFLSTPSDFVRFASALLEGELLDPSMVDELWTPLRLESGELTSQALGWTVGRIPAAADGDSVRIVGQGLAAPVLRRPLSAQGVGGQVAGGTASLLLVPERRVAVSVMTNVSGSEQVATLTEELARLFLELPPSR